MVVRSIASCPIEDAVPIHFSTAQKIAPQELYKSAKEPIMSKTEMSKTDRNRQRRRMKQARKWQSKQKEERARTLARLDPRKQSVLEKRDALKILSRNKNVTILPRKK